MIAEKQFGSPENLQGVVAALRELAEQIEMGQVTVGGVVLSIGKTVSLKVKQKLVSGQVKLDVSLVASLIDKESSKADKPSYLKKIKGAKGKIPKTNKKLRPYEVKKMKKNIAQQWKQISDALAASRTPDAALRADFLQVCQEYGQRAEDEWQPLWQESVAAMKQLFNLAEEGNFQEASLLLTTINDQKKMCHKKFK